LILYEVRLTVRGRSLIAAWQAGDRAALQSALGPVSGGR
jgi:hypothetical protein